MEAPHAAGRVSHDLRAIANWINASEKRVFSAARRDFPWTRSRSLGKFDAGAVRALKKGPGKNIMVFGSGSIVSQLTEHGLADEYHFAMCPVILGEGPKMLHGLSRTTPLSLVDAKPFPSGTVLLRYAAR